MKQKKNGSLRVNTVAEELRNFYSKLFWDNLWRGSLCGLAEMCRGLLKIHGRPSARGVHKCVEDKQRLGRDFVRS